MNLFELFEAETFHPPSIDVGDDVLVGKFKNKKAKVTGFKKDDNNQPVLKTNKGDQKLFKPRIPKLMKEYSERITENTSISDLEFQFFVKEIMEETGAFVEAQVDRNEILINYVESGERGSGYRSLKMLLGFADKHSMKTLLAVLHGAPQLIEYYTKLGFSVDGVTKKGFLKWFSEYKKTWNIDDAEEVTMFRLPKSKSLKETTFKAYHGSNSKIEGDFDEKLIGTGIDSSPFVGGVGMLGKGFYFTPSERKAADYGEHVVEAKLTINNPLMIGKGAKFDSIHDAVNSIAGREVSPREFQDVIRKAGYDGIIKRDYWYPELDEIVVFDPKQIVIARKITEKVTFPAFSPAFKKWFGDSKVVDAEGNPLVVYHNTHADFDTFNPLLGNFGIHFGSAEQANDINKNPVAKMERNPNFRPRILPVYLSIQNPISLPDLEWWGFDNVMEELRNRGIRVYPPSYREKEEDEDDDMNTKEQVEALINALQRHGYDGVVYQNRHEGKTVGGGDSWIAFDSRQVKSAISNKGTFNRNDPRIQEAAPLRYHGTQTSHDLNYRLRDNLELKDDDHATIKELDAMIAPLDQDMVLWRGVKSGFSAVKVGATIRDAGYVSASTSVDQAKGFALGDGAAILRISVKKGTPVIDLRAWEGENEIVIPRGSRYKVDEVIERPGRVPTILLTVV